MTKTRSAAMGGRFKIGVALLCLAFCSGCALIVDNRLPVENVQPELKWDLESYAEFVAQNMSAINARYSKDYLPYEFVVDTENGSTLIQNLIDPISASAIEIESASSSGDTREGISRIHQYIKDEYAFVIQPYEWLSVEETMRTGKGDCKNLSLLMLSMLLSSGHHAYAAISNGHMWVNAYYDSKWHILEIDQDPQRNKVYRLPGFYEYPLYKIYVDHSEKRRRRK
jgi:transglutaminase-like putative cysteine protease